MQEAIVDLAEAAGLERYEVSAFAQLGKRARHNLNYWEFGDYLGIGPGAHGKISFHDRIERQARLRNPETWMQAALARNGTHLAEQRQLTTGELPFEFMLNALRLKQGVAASLYTERCGLPIASMNKELLEATKRGLLLESPMRLQATELGWRFLNELQALFL